VGCGEGPRSRPATDAAICDDTRGGVATDAAICDDTRGGVASGRVVNKHARGLAESHAVDADGSAGGGYDSRNAVQF